MPRLTTSARTYAIVAIVIGAGLTVQTLRQQWSGDVWQHAASLRSFEAHPLHPDHPLAVGLADDPYFLNPWAMTWGVVARVTGLGTFATLVASGMVNLLLIGVGLYRLAVRVSTQRWAPPLALVSLLLLWGPQPWRWSGYASLNSIGFGLPYPSFLAFGLYLVGLTSVIDFTRSRARRELVVLAATVVLSVLCHPLTGAALVLSAVAVAAVDRDRRVRLLGPVLGAMAAGVAVTLLWPFGHLWDLAGAPAAFDEINQHVNRNLLGGAGCALLAAPWVLARVDRPVASPLRAVFVANLLVASIGFLGGSSSAGRFLPFALLPIQLGFAAVLATELEKANRRPLLPVAAALLLLVGLVGARGALPRLVPSQVLPSDLASDERLERASTHAAEVPALEIEEPIAIAVGVDDRLLPANGIRLVSPPYPVATLSARELARREDDSKSFLTASPERQRSIVSHYGVDVLVVPAGNLDATRLGRIIGASATMWIVDVSSLAAP